MYSQQVNLIINVLMLAEGLIIIFSGYAAYSIRWVVGSYMWHMDQAVFLGSILFVMFVNNFIMGQVGLYSQQRLPSYMTIAKRLIVVVCLDFSLLSMGYILIGVDIPTRLFLFLFAGLTFVLFAVERTILEIYLDRRQRKGGFNVHRILLVGNSSRTAVVQNALLRQRSWGHRIVGYVSLDSSQAEAKVSVPRLGNLDDLERVLVEYAVDEVVFAFSRSSKDVDLEGAIELCKNMGIAYRIVPAMYDPDDLSAMYVETIQGIPTLTVNMSRINPTGLLYKRTLDCLVGMLGGLVLLILFPFIAAAIKLDSPGPVFFRQQRVGRHGRVFSMLKFRTMVQDAEQLKEQLQENNHMQGHMFKMEDDPRVTRVGRFLRKTSLDELPQVLNVLSGRMSIVGTRPPTLDEVSHYEQWHRRRISMRPGLTGLWQVSGRNKISDFNQVVQLDLEYIDHWRFINDLAIIWKTFWMVLKRKGAY